MDISEQYIKMCDCPEIQESGHSPITGDFYSYKRYGKYRWQSVIGYANEHHTIGHPIWLPRQDQVQNMCREHFAQKMGSKRPHDEWFPKGDIGLGYVFNGFMKFASDYMREIYNSFEQLWLTFYMYEKHGGIWDGEKWEKK